MTGSDDATLPRASTLAREPKRLKIALQGGGSHGAFSWGVLDRLLEDGRIEVEAIVGASAGAMNAAVTAYGLAIGGRPAARERLAAFWSRASELGRAGPFQPSPIDRLISPGNMDLSPMWRVADMLSKLLSPYELNPGNVNPLRDLLTEIVDFDRLHAAAAAVRLFVCAVNVRTGRLRVFDGAEVSADAVMASACLPFLFQAVEIGGEAYWDGGYCGNPPIFPVIYMGGCPDILIIQINPINIAEVPKSAAAILDRASTLSFNCSLMREMRAIKFVSDLIDRGELDPARHLRVFIHTIDAEAELTEFNVSSKFNPDMRFLRHLFELGRGKADAFLTAHYDDLGARSSTDLAAKFL
jgi:NTE family protein